MENWKEEIINKIAEIGKSTDPLLEIEQLILANDNQETHEYMAGLDTKTQTGVIEHMANKLLKLSPPPPSGGCTPAGCFGHTGCSGSGPGACACVDGTCTWIPDIG